MKKWLGKVQVRLTYRLFRQLVYRYSPTFTHNNIVLGILLKFTTSFSVNIGCCDGYRHLDTLMLKIKQKLFANVSWHRTVLIYVY